MKPAIFVVLAVLLTAAVKADSHASEQDDQIKEYVRVSQVELIVRALDKDGIPKAGLKAQDFTVYEYENPVPVTSCTEIHRRLGTIDLTGKKSPEKAPRIILVYFWIWQQNKSLNQALDYLFDRVYREGDTVILMLPTFSRVIHNADEVAKARKEFDHYTLEWTQRMEQDIQSTVRYIESKCEDFVPLFRSRQGIAQEPEALTFKRIFDEFKSSLEMEWRSFQQRHLEANNRRLMQLAKALRSLKNEKWALVFFQQPVFPAFHPRANLMMRFDNPDYTNQLRELAQTMIRIMNSPRNTPLQMQAVEQAFIHAGATYELVQLDSHTEAADMSKHLVMRDVFSDWKWAFQRITRATGGRVVSDNRANRALARLVNAEDVYYRITYAPRRLEAGKVRDMRKVKIRTRDESLKVFHRERIHLSDVDEIKLVDFQCRPDRLSFVLSGYSVRLEKGALHSSVQVWLTAETPRGETMEFERRFTAPDPFLDVSMKLKFPRPGPYRIYFSAEDRHTGLSVSRTERITIPKTGS